MITVPDYPFDDFNVRLMQDGDAQGVVSLYKAIYGDDYPIREMYDTAFIIRQQEAGLMYRVVVVDASAKVLAHQALFRLSETYHGLYESGHGMVLPGYRGKGVSDATQAYIAGILIPAMGVEECWGEAVTNHTLSQKSALRVGVKENGIELDVMPGELYEAGGRVSTVLSSIIIKDKPHTVYLPLPYAELLTAIYDNGKRSRRLESGTQAFPESATTRCADTFIAGAGVLRLTIFEAGRNVDEIITGLIRQYEAAGAVVMQVFLPLDKPWSGALTDVLNRHGFFFAALMPRWFDHDGLLLQKLVRQTDYAGIKLFSDFAKNVLKSIIRDRTRVDALSGKP